MQNYQHDRSSVEDYLHHRSPYLLVDEIRSITDKRIVTSKELSGDEIFSAGHFPGAPVLPGAMMQEMTTQSAGILIAARYNPMREFDTHDPYFNEYALGVLVRVNHARFKGFARPGDQLTVQVDLNEQVENLFDFSASVSIAGKPIMRNAFRLTNIRSSVLQGTGTTT